MLAPASSPQGWAAVGAEVSGVPVVGIPVVGAPVVGAGVGLGEGIAVAGAAVGPGEGAVVEACGVAVTGTQSPQEKRHDAVANWACQSTVDVQ